MKVQLLRRFVASAASMLMVAVMLSVATYPARAANAAEATAHGSVCATCPQ